MSNQDARTREAEIFNICSSEGLLEYQRLVDARLINTNHVTVCPLCLEELSGDGFFSRMQQAAGREVPDLTVTEINLFHIDELRVGIYNHRPYNLGWGHHHCNVVAKDSGIDPTLRWMQEVIKRNTAGGYTN